MGTPRTLPVRAETRGAVPGDAARTAARKVATVLRAAPEPVLHTRVRVTMAADPAVPRPVLAQANVDLNGRPIRAQAAGATADEAVDRMVDRLRTRLARAARNWKAVRGTGAAAAPGAWRRPRQGEERPPTLPAEEATIVRHKSYTLAECDADEAAAEMELLDYDFHLFTERASGRDSVIYRADGGYRLAQAGPPASEPGPHDPAISVSEDPVPVLTPTEAATRLVAMDRAFVFFVDAATGRGNVLYRRYDGAYGLITPAGG